MSRLILTALCSVALAITASACSSNKSVIEEELNKDEYLKGNFPAKKQGKQANPPVQTTFDK